MSKCVLLAILKKSIDSFNNKNIECKQCSIKSVSKRYYINKVLIQKRPDKYERFKDLDKRLKVL